MRGWGAAVAPLGGGDSHRAGAVPWDCALDMPGSSGTYWEALGEGSRTYREAFGWTQKLWGHTGPGHSTGSSRMYQEALAGQQNILGGTGMDWERQQDPSGGTGVDWEALGWRRSH